MFDALLCVHSAVLVTMPSHHTVSKRSAVCVEPADLMAIGMLLNEESSTFDPWGHDVVLIAFHHAVLLPGEIKWEIDRSQPVLPSCRIKSRQIDLTIVNLTHAAGSAARIENEIVYLLICLF